MPICVLLYLMEQLLLSCKTFSILQPDGHNFSAWFKICNFHKNFIALCFLIAGPVRIQTHRPTMLQSTTSTTFLSLTPTSPIPTTAAAKRPKAAKDTSTSLTTECANVSISMGPVRTPNEVDSLNPNKAAANPNNTVSDHADGGFNTVWQILTNPYYQDYGTALTITLGISVVLLLLNFLIFACVYSRCERTADPATKKKRRPHADSPVEHHLIEGKFLDPMPIRYGEPSTSYVAVDCDISLKEFETTAQIINTKSTSTECSPTMGAVTSADERLYEQDSSDNTEDQSPCLISPSIPEPPPPPKNLPPSNCYQSIRKLQPGQQQVLASNKKRVQIQEISV